MIATPIGRQYKRDYYTVHAQWAELSGVTVQRGSIEVLDFIFKIATHCRGNARTFAQTPSNSLYYVADGHKIVTKAQIPEGVKNLRYKETYGYIPMALLFSCKTTVWATLVNFFGEHARPERQLRMEHDRYVLPVVHDDADTLHPATEVSALYMWSYILDTERREIARLQDAFLYEESEPSYGSDSHGEEVKPGPEAAKKKTKVTPGNSSKASSRKAPIARKSVSSSSEEPPKRTGKYASHSGLTAGIKPTAELTSDDEEFEQK